MGRIWVIVPAAGCGSRFDQDLPKQYTTLLGRSMAEWTLSHLLAMVEFETVVVVLSEKDAWFSDLAVAALPRLERCAGGRQRFESVLNGLYHLKDRAEDSDWVFVHDIARPCIMPEDLKKLITYCRSQHAGHAIAGVLGAPVADSIKKVTECELLGKASHPHSNSTTNNSTIHNPTIIEHVKRDPLWRAFTPQVCLYGDLLQALLSVKESGAMVNDEAEALAFINKPVAMIEGRTDKIKVTYPNDLSLVEMFLRDNGFY